MTEPNILSCLPEAFLTRMKEMLGNEYEAFLESYTRPRTFGLRLNTAKISAAEFEKIVPFPVTPIPWVKNAYFYPADVRPSRCPLYQAGLYYLQEPSAMTPASCLPAEPGDVVLDLCAAPGGKATALGSALKGEGLLVANDISASRARALLRNLELFGVSNSLLVNETPARLLERFPAYFNKILLDAPCSGEGMFRKEEALAKDWTPEKSRELSKIQRELILQAADMLRPGGLLLYSTCTFAPEEDEANADWLVRAFPELTCTEQKKIYPHRERGEGHFAARFIKEDGERAAFRAPKLPADRAAVAAYRAFAGDFLRRPIEGTFASFGNSLCLLPGEVFPLGGLRVLRCGLQLGTMEGRRFVPAHALALGVPRQDIAALCSYPQEDIARYLHGEELPAAELRGWCAVAYEGWPLGLGKSSASMKNHYPKGLRRP